MTAKAIMRPATAADAVELAANLRPADAEECRAGTGRDPLPVLLEGLKESAEAHSIVIGGELAGVWGVVPLGGSVLGGRLGLAWLMTTKVVERHAKEFWRLCLREMPHILERWGCLVNAIDARHAQAVRWARRLGFHVGEPRPWGDGAMFHPFSVRKEDLRCALQP